MKVKELKDTIELMNSENYVDRFKAEVYQLNIRYRKLVEMCLKWDNDKLDFTPTCPRGLYNIQKELMYSMLVLLMERAKIENIEL